MIPKNAKKIALRPLALGEQTGHHHSLQAEPGIVLDDVAEMYEVPGTGETYLRITGDGVSIQHQEHKTHAVPPGEYRVTIQQEETNWGRQNVMD